MLVYESIEVFEMKLGVIVPADIAALLEPSVNPINHSSDDCID